MYTPTLASSQTGTAVVLGLKNSIDIYTLTKPTCSKQCGQTLSQEIMAVSWLNNLSKRNIIVAAGTSMIYCLEKREDGLKTISTCKMTKEEYKSSKETRISGYVDGERINIFIYRPTSALLLFLTIWPDTNHKGEYLHRLHYLPLSKLLPIYTSLKVIMHIQPMISKNLQDVLFWANDSIKGPTKVLIGAFDAYKEVPSVGSYKCIMTNIPQNVRKIVPIEGKEAILFMENTRLVMRSTNKLDDIKVLSLNKLIYDLVEIKPLLFAGVGLDKILLVTIKEGSLCVAKEIAYTGRTLLKIIATTRVIPKENEYLLFGLNLESMLYKASLHIAAGSSPIPLSEHKGLPNAELVQSQLVNQVFLHNKLQNAFHIISHQKTIQGAHCIKIEATDKTMQHVQTIHKAFLDETVIWLHIAYLNAESFDYYLLGLLKDYDGIVYVAMFNSSLMLTVKTKLAGIEAESIKNAIWDKHNRLLCMLINDEDKTPTKVVRIELAFDPELRFIVKNIEPLNVTLHKLKEYPAHSLRLAISSSGQLIIIIKSPSWEGPVLTIELNSYSERMQLLQRPTKVTEQELAILDEDFGIFQKERVLSSKVADLVEYVQHKTLKVWVLTNYAVYLLQCSLNFNPLQKDKPETSYLILDHIPYSKLGIDSSQHLNQRIKKVDENNVLISPDNKEIYKLRIKTVLDPGTLQLKRSISMIWRKKLPEKVLTFSYNEDCDKILAKINNKITSI